MTENWRWVICRSLHIETVRYRIYNAENKLNHLRMIAEFVRMNNLTNHDRSHKIYTCFNTAICWRTNILLSRLNRMLVPKHLNAAYTYSLGTSISLALTIEWCKKVYLENGVIAACQLGWTKMFWHCRNCIPFLNISSYIRFIVVNYKRLLR